MAEVDSSDAASALAAFAMLPVSCGEQRTPAAPVYSVLPADLVPQVSTQASSEIHVHGPYVTESRGERGVCIPVTMNYVGE